MKFVADVDGQAGEVILVIHWKGGVHTELRLARRRRGQCSGHTSKEIVDAVRILAHTCTDDIIAGMLNRNPIGYRSRKPLDKRAGHVTAKQTSDLLLQSRQRRIES